MRWSRAAISAALALVLGTGCGDNDRTTSPTPIGEPEVPFGSGPLTGATRGPVSAPEITNSAQATVMGLAGRFTRLQFHDPRTTVNSAPIYAGAGTPAPVTNHIYRIPAGGGEPVQLTAGLKNEYNPGIDPSGTRLAYWEGNDLGEDFGGLGRLIVSAADGSNPTPLGSFGVGRPRPVWTPDGNFLLFSTQATVGGPFVLVRVEIATGDSSTLLSGPGFMSAPGAAILDGVPTVLVGIHSGFVRIRLTTLATDTILKNLIRPELIRFSPDGARVAYVTESSARLSPTRDLATFRTITLPGGGFMGFAWTPDNAGYVAPVFGEDGPFALQFHLLDTLGVIQRQLTDLPLQFHGDFSVGPAPPASGPSVLLGPGGILGDSASGIVIGQTAGGQVSSLVAFLADQQASVELVQQTGLNATAPALSFLLRAGSLRSMRVASGAALDSVQVVLDSTTSPTGGAVITFDASNGTLGLVLLLPAESLREMAIEDRGSLRVFRGDFTGVYVPNGKTQARGPVHEVTLDLPAGTVQVAP